MVINAHDLIGVQVANARVRAIIRKEIATDSSHATHLEEAVGLLLIVEEFHAGNQRLAIEPKRPLASAA